VIRADVSGDRVVLVATLPQGSFAYVDKDWIPRSSGAAAAIIAPENGGLAWCGRAPGPVPSGFDLDTAAAAALLAVAREAAGVEGLTMGTVEVTGNGLISQQVRASIGNTFRVGEVERPQAIVDVTGDVTVIADATRRVADLGTVVLAGESLGQVELNLYPDVHARGLTVVGISSPLQDATFESGLGPDDPVLRSCLELLIEVRSRAPLSPDGAWYRVSADA
jgi:threonine dehydrogenase-like Zn-dependent dehydrogenase